MLSHLSLTHRLVTLLAVAGLAPNLHAFDFDRSMNLNEQLTIERDLINLCRLNYSLPFAEKGSFERRLSELTGIREINCRELQAFLRERIQVITKDIADDSIFLTTEEVDRATQFTVFWELIPAILVDERSQLPRSSLVAHSLGTSLYIKLKSPNKTRHLPPELAAQDLDFSFHYTTPQGESKTTPIQARQNIIQVGDAFFHSPLIPNPDNQVAIANSIYRIGVLLHEIKHSTDELRFQHVPCGALLCDSTPDGPYTLETLFFHYAWNLCALSNQCSAEELVRLNGINWGMLQHIPNLAMAAEQPSEAIRHLLSEPTECVSPEPSPRRAIEHPAVQELFLSRPLVNAQLVADVFSQVIFPGQDLSPESDTIKELTELINGYPSDIFLTLGPLIDLRGTLALPADKHFVATTVEALDYQKRHCLQPHRYALSVVEYAARPCQGRAPASFCLWALPRRRVEESVSRTIAKLSAVARGPHLSPRF